MATGLQVWSTTAASNATADSAVNWAEGMAPSAVNDSARAEMAAAAKWRDDNNGTLATSGTTLAFTVTTNQGSTALTAGYTVSAKLHGTADSSATLAVDGLTAKPIQIIAGTNLAGSELAGGTIQRFTYSSTGTGQWIAHNHHSLGAQASVVGTTNITAAAVTYAKIQNETDQTVLGNFGGVAAAPSEYTLKGPSVSGSTLVFPFPPQASFKNLSIKVASNTTVTVAADYVSLATANSSSVTTTPLGGTINFGTTGANALDSGTIASGTFYAIYGLGPSSTSTTTACLIASTSFTTPGTLLTGYDRWARIGAVVTSTSTASSQLYGTWQFGRKTQYVLGLAQTSTIPFIAQGVVGTYGATSTTYAKTTVSGVFVPTTASVIGLTVSNKYNNSTLSNCVVAPSTTYDGPATTKPPFLYPGGAATATVSGWMMLESTQIAVAADAAGGLVNCTGWEDNI